ncbi:transcription factor IIF subunit tfg1 [Zygosaccharomyces mellis]|uniref:Transcription initiation factor IIF subunit alpha n=1 Tax=Zygosaccharomyces mellis TaxID=42258 RepID=A0A4C2ECI6_9SACH|nr:transcription factor IIF subunit tfg1 [Zygosaccharomyces mellis]
MAYSRNGNGSSGVSPFIKPDRLRRNFLKARMSRGATPRTTIKKDDPEMQEAREKMMLHQDNGNMENGKIKVKEEVPEEFNEFPLRAVAKEELDNMRTHLLKFQSKKGINPKQDFHLPIRLHRKDTRNLQFQLTRAEIVQRQKEITDYKKKQEQERSGNKKSTENVAQNKAEEAVEDQDHADGDNPSSVGSQRGTEASPKAPSDVMNSQEGQNAEQTISENSSKPNEGMPVVTKLEEAGPAADPTKVGMVKYDGEEDLDDQDDLSTMDPLADVAPDGGGRAKRGNTRRKTRQLKVLDENAKKLRFEEFYPWVMEDFDGYNTWVGSYEAGNSDSYVLLSVEDDGSFTMIPADKVYKFTARNKYATLTIEEAEKRMDKKSGEVPRWLMKHLDNIGTTTTRYDRTKRRLKAVNDQRGNDDGEHSDNSEVELDYDEEFADDEEAPIIDGDEKENKESEQKIKKEMLQANAMGLRDEDAPNEDEEDDLFNEKKIDEEGERIKRALQKTELAALYSSDDEEINPYLSESDVENKEQSEQANKENSEELPSSKKGSPKKNSDSSLNAHREPQIKVKSIKDCVIVLKTDKKVLANFPRGDWNPELANRKREGGEGDAAESIPSKKVKLEENTTSLITEQDIIDAIGDGKVNVKDFGKTIRRKYPGPDNKKLMVAIVKKLCRKVDDEHMELKR